MEAKVIALVILGPLAALYDFVTNPTAPPQIFVSQYTEAFGHPPPRPIVPKVVRFYPKKRVYVTRG